MVGQIIFSLAFLSSCEIPNWAYGPRSPNECVDRWMFVTGLFAPSSIQAGLGSTSPARTKRPTPHTDPDTI
jgi:hypothetical protein